MSWRSKGRPDHPPIVCAGRHGNAIRLTGLDEAAEALGLKHGQGLAEARAMFPMLDVMDEDAGADAALLSALADWCDRYTPLVALDGHNGLFLDITGCAHLFGGEERLLEDILNRLSHLGFDARGAISSSPGLSSAISRFSRSRVIADQTVRAGLIIREALAPLPVRALRLDEAIVAALAKLGLKRVGDLFGLDRAPLARRFGAVLLLRLDQALGNLQEAISPRRPVALLSAERKLAEPVEAEEDILGLAERLAVTLEQALEARGLGGRLFELVLFRVDGRVFRISAGASQPLRDPRRVARLFAERLTAVHDDLDAGFGFELLRLNILSHDVFRMPQGDLEGKGQGEISLADFIDRVSARLGDTCLLVADMRQSHVPEHAEAFSPAALSREGPFQGHGARSDKAVARPEPQGRFTPATDRPLRILRHPEAIDSMLATVPDGPPQQFRWRHVVHAVICAEGPERIAPEWWLADETERERDYYKLESTGGHRFWVFRKGRYGSADAPTWHMHGVFA
jgi:protein ImuB